jgi:CRP-like cAMP-binding protein
MVIRLILKRICSKTDIAEGAKMSRATLFKVWPRLEALDLISTARPKLTNVFTSRLRAFA